MSNYNRIGDYIQLVDNRNKKSEHDNLLGININKFFMPSVANIVGTDLSRYKIVKYNQFACNRMHVGRDYRIPIALSKDKNNFIISPAYTVFEIIDTEELLPEYLMMWFSRKEFDRNAWFYTDADVRGGLHLDAFCDMELPVPHIDKQKEIVKEYNVIVNRIKLNEQLNQKLEETAQAIYKQWFIDFEFPCLPSDYRPHGQVNLKISENELIAKINKVSTYSRVGGLPVPDRTSWFIYILLCEDGSFYKGMTNDLYRRFYEHFTGQGAKYTKQHKPVKVIHWEQFSSQEEARKREEELKTGYGRTWIKREYEKFLKYGFTAAPKDGTGSSAPKDGTGLPAPEDGNGLPAPKDGNGLPAPEDGTGLPAHQTRLMMAGEMVYNEELEKNIPMGWSDDVLCEIAKITMGQSPAGESYNDNGKGEVFFQGRTDFNYRFPIVRMFTTEPKRFANNGDILMSVRAPVGDINISKEKCCIGRGLSSLRSKNNCNTFLLYLMLNLKKSFEVSNTEGTIFGSINKDTLYNLQILKPKNELILLFENIVKKIDNKIKNQCFQELTLLEIKNLLLSKMTKGEIS